MPAPAFDHHAAFRRFEAMGTCFELVLASCAHGASLADRAALAEVAEQLVCDEHQRLSVFDPHSLVSVLNREAGTRPVPVDPELFALLRRCVGYALDTRGAFDITAGALMHAHGFRADSDPDAQHSMPVCGSEHVHLDPGARTVRFDRPGIQLDLGGIAKGYALDTVSEELRAHGVTSAMVHGGTSSVVGIGLAPDATPWRARLLGDDPSSPTVDLVDRALACSSPAGRTVYADGRSAGHIMDLRRGRPASGVDAACVLGPSAEVCEAWSTALVVDPELVMALPAGYDAYISCNGVWQTYRVPACSADAVHNQFEEVVHV